MQLLQGYGFARARRMLVPLLCCAALVGCAGGAWRESPAEADLPLDFAAHPYPTVVDPNAPPPPQAKAKQRAEERPQALPATPLAAVPAHLRQRQTPPVPIAIKSQYSGDPIPISLPPRAANSPNTAPTPTTSTPAPPAALPASAAPASTPAAATPNSATVGSGLNIVRPAAAPVVSPATALSAEPIGNSATAVAAGEDRQAKIDRARDELIADLEAEIRERRSRSATDEALPRLEQQLRLLYLAANRLDEAVTSVESLDEPQRESFKHAMFGLGVWMSPDEARRAPLRSAKVLRSLRDATTELAAASKLELRTLAFCERVEQFGWFTEFSRNEFRPKQQVILYVEIENFAAEKKGASYETELQGSYQIFDEGGRIVAERQLPLDRETCRNYRRDYFLAYPMYLPDSIEPGRYRLELTVEDLKASGDYQGRKFGEGMIEFTIRQ